MVALAPAQLPVARTRGVTPDLSLKRAVPLAWLLLALIAILRPFPDTAWLGIGPDPDDAMRFLQLRDLLGGQGWFDLAQHRLGPDGTAIHWSRLSDLPFLLVALPLQPLLGTDTALRVAGTLVPLLLVGPWVWGTLRAARALLGKPVPAALLAGIAAVVGLPLAFRFAPGAFDHHGLQIALLAVAIGTTVAPTRCLAPLAALAVAASAVVGLETVPWTAALAAGWAVLWAVEPGRDDLTRAFALTLLFSSLAAWWLFVAPGTRLAPVCDAWGLPAALALALGAGGLLALTHLPLRTPLARLGGLAALGGMVGAALLLAAPGCLADPMSALPGNVRTEWLAGVAEARPVMSPEVKPHFRAIYLGNALFAAACALLMALGPRSRPNSTPRATWWLLAALAMLSLAVTAHQIRFSSFAQASAACVGIAALARAVEAERWAHHPILGPRRGQPLGSLLRILMIGGAALGASAMLRGLAVSTLLRTDTAKPEASITARAQACLSPAALDALSADADALLWTSTDHAPRLMLQTPVRPFAGNYHRGADDISRWLRLRDLSGGEAGAALHNSGVALVLLCPDGVMETNVVKAAPDGWIATLLAGGTVAGLARDTREGFSREGGARLYRVEP